jgi:pilus assembly protein TadC
MNTKLRATRAVLSLLARRVIFFGTVVAIVVFALIFAGCWALAYYVSPWWWILLVAYIPLLLVFIVIRLVVGFFINKLYPVKSLTSKQRKAARNFVDKLQRLAETRGIGWPMFAFICFKDLLFYRDLRTARSTLEDGTSLRKDFQYLEDTFKD